MLILGRRDLDSLIRLVETGKPDEDSPKEISLTYSVHLITFQTMLVTRNASSETIERII